MKFYEFIESLQSLNPNKIIMIKTGAFFNSIGRDAIILEYTLGLKRSCFAKGLCKVGFPVSYVRDNLEEIKKRLKDKNLGIIIYDEVKNGRYKFKNKNYDIILELNGDEIEETRKNTDCNECKKNVYGKVTNRYKIRKEDYEKLAKKVEDFLNSIKEILNIKKWINKIKV